MEHDGATVIEIVDFVVSHYPKYSGKERKVDGAIRKAVEYKTYDYGYDDKGLVYVVRFNVIENGSVADVLDFIVRDDARGIKIVKYVISRCWSKFPHLKEIRYQRFSKYPYRGYRKYKLLNFFQKGYADGRRYRDCTGDSAGTADGRAERG